MKKMQRLLCFIAIISLNSCSPKISTTLSRSYPSLGDEQKVVLIGLVEEEPDNSEFLGKVKVGDTGFTTKCAYDFVIEQAKSEARKIGGNAIKIVDHSLPTLMGSTCHRIVANILKIEDIENYNQEKPEEVLRDLDYAILNVYRYGGVGAWVGYNLYVGDSLICRVKNSFKATLHIKKDGLKLNRNLKFQLI